MHDIRFRGFQIEPSDSVMQAEGRLVREILAALRAQPRTYAVKSHGSIYSRRGEPDIHGCYRGTAFAIEVKVPGGRATALQLHRLDAWSKAGALVGIAYSVEDALAIAAGE